jgi:hypothetical protein
MKPLPAGWTPSAETDSGFPVRTEFPEYPSERLPFSRGPFVVPKKELENAVNFSVHDRKKGWNTCPKYGSIIFV